jgi:hypothetical protein
MSQKVFKLENSELGNFLNVVTVQKKFACGCPQPVTDPLKPPPILPKEQQQAPFGDNGKVLCAVCNKYVALVINS